MLLHVNSFVFPDFVKRSLIELSKGAGCYHTTTTPEVNFSQVRVKVDNGNYKTRSFFENNFGLEPMVSDLKSNVTGVKSKSDVVHHMNDAALFTEKVTINGLRFEDYSERLNETLAGGISPEIIDTSYKLRMKDFVAGKRNELAYITQGRSKFIDLDDFYELCIEISVCAFDEAATKSYIDTIKTNAASMGLTVDQKPKKTLLAKVKQLFEDKNTKNFKACNQLPEAKLEAISQNWLVNVFQYSDETNFPLQQKLTPIQLTGQNNEHVEWSPFYSFNNFNVMAYRSQNDSMVRKAIEQFTQQNSVAYSANTCMFVPTSEYSNLDRIKLNIFEGGKWLFNLDPLPYFQKIDDCEYRDDLVVEYFTAILCSVREILSGDHKEHVNLFLESAAERSNLFHYLLKQKETTTLGLITTLLESDSIEHQRLGQALNIALPAHEGVFNSNKPSLYDIAGNVVIDSEQFEHTAMEHILSVTLLLWMQTKQRQLMAVFVLENVTPSPVSVVIDSFKRRARKNGLSVITISKADEISNRELFTQSKFTLSDVDGGIKITEAHVEADHHIPLLKLAS